MVNIILCGGSGTRLWPISRKLMPKQFLKLFNDKSLFQLTVERNSKVCNKQIIVSNQEQYFLALDQLAEIEQNNSQYLLEPVGRNTAPAIALACMAVDKEEIVLITPSDHLIQKEVEYQKVLKKAKELAKQNFLVTFGIEPTSAETGYGYIEANHDDVLNFHEKPNLEKAKEYLKKGNYYWNSGMFCFKAGVFLEELKKYTPEIYETSKIAFDHKKIQHSTFRIQHSYMESIPSESIDYAIMEKSKIVKVVSSNIAWSDVGSFDALISEIKSKEAIEIESKNNFYYSDAKDKVIATVGLEDFIVVDTKDALLISKKGKTQKVKDIVNQLKTSNLPLLTTHSIVYRPWGSFETLITDNGYKIKRIIVQPNKRLSLQKHYHRSEHWIVVSGTAKVTVGDNTYLVRPNESTYIKMGEIHRLENPGKIPVVLIEAQVGQYTDEDDIVRIEDDFSRGNQ
jgi:mannose-1-phosphate guanylyltransferase